MELPVFPLLHILWPLPLNLSVDAALPTPTAVKSQQESTVVR